MSRALPRLIYAALLVVIVAGPLALRRSPVGGNTARSSNGGERLVVFTPHNDQIRYEFAVGFNRWRSRQGLPPVTFDWRSSAGTSDLRKQVVSQFTKLARAGREDDGIGADLFFGGGQVEHDTLARGISLQRGGGTVNVALTAPIDLTATQLTAIFGELNIGGEQLVRRGDHGAKPMWVGAALASFGIIYNRDVLSMMDGLAPPTGWNDLCDARYRGWLVFADPAHSGSAAATYDAILRRRGWHAGWKVLRRVFANSRSFVTSAAAVPLEVAAGQAAAGMSIDFYGRYQVGATPDDRIGYIDPRSPLRPRDGASAALETAVTADPISILRGAPHPESALQFVTWVLSESGQGLWQRRIGVEGGPMRYELRRLPIRRDMYRPQQMQHWTDNINPFDLAQPLPPGMPGFYRMVAPLAHAMAVDVHRDLQRAWTTIFSQPHHPNRDRMLQLFDAMPEGTDDRDEDLSLRIKWADGIDTGDIGRILTDPDDPHHRDVIGTLQRFTTTLRARYTTPGSKRGWNDRDKLLRHRLAWTGYFRHNYREIVELGRR